MSTSLRSPELIAQRLEKAGVSRRDFLGFCGKLIAAAPFGLALTSRATAEEVAEKVGKAKRLSVIWLHFQDCTGCSETLLRTSQPDLAELILELISLDYHETIMAAAGHEAEKSLHDAMDNNWGEYVVVVEGSIPTKHGGVYMKLAGKNAIDVLHETAKGAAAIIGIGSCAAWGGIPSSAPNPTGAVGVDEVISDKPIVNIPGCPPNPYTLLGVVLQYATNGTLPALDGLKRPKFAFDRVIHEHCPRRPHFDAGRFVRQYGDEGHRQGWCLYQMGCKGPMTHAGCSTRHFNEVVGAWPIGIGAPCVGCTEEALAFKVPQFAQVPITAATPPTSYPLVGTQYDKEASPLATAIVGAVAGAIAGGAYVASQRVDLTVQGETAEAVNEGERTAKGSADEGK